MTSEILDGSYLKVFCQELINFGCFGPRSHLLRLIKKTKLFDFFNAILLHHEFSIQGRFIGRSMVHKVFSPINILDASK